MRLWSLTLLITLAFLSPGCGGSTRTTSERARLAQLGALALSICREQRGRQRDTGSAFGQPADLVLLARMLREDHQIPRVRALLASLEAKHTLRKELEGKPSATAVWTALDRAYQLDERIYTDAKALGLPSCLNRPPRKPIRG